MIEKKARRNYSAKEKFDSVKSVITKTKTTSEICKELNIHPNLFYKWQKDFFDGAFERFSASKVGRKNIQEKRKNEALESKITKLNEVISEVVNENIDLKKKYF